MCAETTVYLIVTEGLNNSPCALPTFCRLPPVVDERPLFVRSVSELTVNLCERLWLNSKSVLRQSMSTPTFGLPPPPASRDTTFPQPTSSPHIRNFGSLPMMGSFSKCDSIENPGRDHFSKYKTQTKPICIAKLQTLRRPQAGPDACVISSGQLGSWWCLMRKLRGGKLGVCLVSTEGSKQKKNIIKSGAGQAVVPIEFGSAAGCRHSARACTERLNGTSQAADTGQECGAETAARVRGLPLHPDVLSLWATASDSFVGSVAAKQQPGQTPGA